MKRIFLLLSILFLTNCSTLPQVHTEYEKKIEKNKREMYDDGRDLIAKAKDILQKSKSSKNPEISQAIDILEKGQGLIDGRADDGQELKNLEGKELTKAVDDIIKKDKPLAKENEELKDKNDELLSQTIAKQIETDAIKHYERSKSVKFYTICLTILSIIGTLIYFFPSQAMGIGIRILGFFKNIFFSFFK